MVFNSLPFVAFFVVFFFLYWFVVGNSLRLQNILILAGSYFFYAWWDWRFLSLLIIQSLINYLLGIRIAKAPDKQKKDLMMYLGSIISIGILIYFKYSNFFIESFLAVFPGLHIGLLNLVLPLGISFYTFRTLSYLFDVHKNKIKPVTDWVVFFSYVAFFPSLLSGPIDKVKTLVPQLEKSRTFDYDTAVDALRQILWGLFKKIVIADQLAGICNNIYSNYHTLPGSTLLLGTFYFAIQLYTDFSGYSDMAIGIARLLGFSITKNFDFPFFAQSISQFWRKWHMSLTSWLTEYVFTPLSISFRDYETWGQVMAVMINFTVIGIWHGANWTFILFGILHGLYYIPAILRGTINKKFKTDTTKKLPTLPELANMLQTFTLVSFSFILFRSNSVTDAAQFFARIFTTSIRLYPVDAKPYLVAPVLLFLVVEWFQRSKQHVLQIQNLKYGILRWGIYLMIFCTILIIISNEDSKEAGFMYVKF
ncbi:hypothetical protein A0256_22805 [Mucilaginibacter sp. PAMC 26640]|nr:hypothetical protein A0256_22805 [Mucilaginibacter sp. PAMC 26640]